MNVKDYVAKSVSRETLERLETFEQLVLKWTPKINLIGRNDVDRIWERHILDSAQVFDLADSQFSTWFDLGSGGGFPGIVCAIIAAERCPHATFSFIESDNRKAVFLRQAIVALSIKGEVHSMRIEVFKGGKADVISARALASLDTLLQLSWEHIDPSTQLLFPKGRKAGEELKLARRWWDMKVERIPSLTDAEASVLKITGVTKRHDRS